MTRSFALIAGVAILAAASSRAENTTQATVLDKKFYWLLDGMRLDTIGWDTVDQVCRIARTEVKHAKAAAGKYRAAGKALWRLRSPTAISMALISDLGYPVLAFSQWNCTPGGELQRSRSTGGVSYADARLTTDYLWEVLERYEVEKPTPMRDDYLLRLHFRRGAYSQLDGKEVVDRSISRAVYVGAEGASIKHDGDQGSVDLSPGRRIHSVYIVTDAAATPAKIVGRIEAQMDKLKLDLSYKIPELVPAEGETGRKGKK